MPETKQKTAAAALALLTDYAWHEITLPLLAKKSKQPLAQLEKLLDSKEEILPLINNQIDRLTLQATPEAEEGLSLTELLFDILMTRFEVMEPYRFGLTALADEARRTPEIAYPLYKAHHKSMSLYLTHAGDCPTGLAHNLHTALLVGTYYLVFIKWCRDTSPDLSRTMAGLNRALQTLERIGLKKWD
ncbi:MAG TPA: hypothetical protein DD400_01000 [Rhodospirillaceae bacterium]|nr:hypothetical protein [Rhodospirillaceae bacterium]